MRKLSIILAIAMLAVLAGALPVAAGATLQVPSAYSTIQLAIDAAVSGDTIEVGPGTYDENVSITKSLTLRSTGGAAATIINGQGTNQTAAVSIAAGVSGVTIGGPGQGFTINGHATSVRAVYLMGNVSGVVFEGNIVNAAPGKHALDTTGGQSNHAISGNTFAGSGTVSLVYINGEASLGASNASSGVNFYGNLFQGDSAVSPALGQEAANSTISGNTFTFVSGYAVLELWGSGNTVTGNSFQSAQAAGKPHVLANLVSGADVGAILAGNTFVQGVAVKHDGSFLPSIWPRIADGLAAALSGDTIHLAAGTYNESLTINKANLTLKGANAGIPAGRCPGDRGTESIIEDGTIDINATGVTVDGIKLVRNGVGAPPAAKYGIHVIGTGATIENSIFDGAAGEGNKIRGVLVHSPAAGSTNNVVVRACTMTEWATGIYLNDPNVVTITGNLLEGNYVGMSSDDPVDLDVIENSFIGNIFEGWGVSLNPSASAQAHYNSFERNGVALATYKSGTTVDATFNWWGSTDGPATTGLNSVGANVDTSDWLSPEPEWCTADLPPDAPMLWVVASDYSTDKDGKVDASVMLNAGDFEVFGFEFTLNYDSNVLDLDDVVPGAALSTLTQLEEDDQTGYWWQVDDATPGAIKVWVTLAGKLSGFTTESELVQVSFTAAPTGDCADTGDVWLSDEILSQKEDGARIHPVTVGAPVTITAYKLVPVSGVVQLQGRASGKWNGATVSLTGSPFSYAGIVTDVDGRWGTEVACGTYDVYVDMNAYLDAESKAADIASAWNRMVKLLGGNADETPDTSENRIFLEDVVAIARVIGEPVAPGEAWFQAPFYPDINADNTINILDLVLAGINYTETGPKPIPDN